jgi:hypothetical protein
MNGAYVVDPSGFEPELRYPNYLVLPLHYGSLRSADSKTIIAVALVLVLVVIRVVACSIFYRMKFVLQFIQKYRMHSLYLKIISLFKKSFKIEGYDIRDSVLDPILKELNSDFKCNLATNHDILSVYGYQFIWNNTDKVWHGLEVNSFGIWHNQQLIKQFKLVVTDGKINLRDVNKVKKWLDKRFSTLFQRIIKSPFYVILSIAILQIITAFSAELGKYIFNKLF